MGLLDDLLGSLGTQQMARQTNQPPSSGQGSSQVLLMLLPVVLGMLNRRGGRAPQAGINQGRTGAGGGIGDLLGSLLGGSAGGGGGMGGGLGGLLDQIQRAGFGEQAQSWVGTGQNQPLPPDAIEQVFGKGGLAQIARHVGLTEAETGRGLSQLLPEVVNHVTPDGKVPNFDTLTASVDALARKYGVS